MFQSQKPLCSSLEHLLHKIHWKLSLKCRKLICFPQPKPKLFFLSSDPCPSGEQSALPQSDTSSFCSKEWWDSPWWSVLQLCFHKSQTEWAKQVVTHRMEYWASFFGNVCLSFPDFGKETHAKYKFWSKTSYMDYICLYLLRNTLPCQKPVSFSYIKHALSISAS